MNMFGNELTPNFFDYARVLNFNLKTDVSLKIKKPKYIGLIISSDVKCSYVHISDHI